MNFLNGIFEAQHGHNFLDFPLTRKSMKTWSRLSKLIQLIWNVQSSSSLEP